MRLKDAMKSAARAVVTRDGYRVLGAANRLPIWAEYIPVDGKRTNAAAIVIKYDLDEWHETAYEWVLDKAD